MSHIPVLLRETIESLAPERGGVFVDATLGFGGHAKALLEAAEQAKVSITLYGIDQDKSVGEKTAQELGDKVHYLHGNFSEITELLRSQNVKKVDGMLMDIGVSSHQIDTPERGFSFQHTGPLDMRMNQEGDLTAADIVNTWPERELADLIFKYGEERLSRKIARVIVERRQKEPFTTTTELAELIALQYHPKQRFKKPHPATRTFQALRMEINQELQVLEDGMNQAFELLAPGGRLAIISFHSLEDRMVKHTFRDKVAEGGFTLVQRKAIKATEEEIAVNSRSRSAKLRVIEKN